MPGAPVRVVTVSATYGAGGTLIAPMVADRLGLPFADRLIPLQREDAVASAEALTPQEEAEQPPSRLAGSLGILAAGGWVIPTPTDAPGLPEQVRADVEASIKELVASGGGVILGRAAAAVLAGHPRSFHVRLDGPEERRAEAGARWEQIDLATAREHLKRTDSVRTKYVKRLYRCDPADPSLYHLVLDSTALPAETCVDLIVSAAEAFWAALPTG